MLNTGRSKTETMLGRSKLLDNTNPNEFVLGPDSKELLYWQFFKFLGCVYYLASVPYKMAFLTTPSNSVGVMFVFDFFVDAFFWVDIYVNFHSGYYDKGKKVMNLEAIQEKYLKGTFVLDLLPCLPLDIFQLVADEINPAFRVLKLLRMLNAVQIIDIVEAKPGVNFTLVRYASSFGNILKQNPSSLFLFISALSFGSMLLVCI